MYNYHTHTKRCGHAVGEDEEYVIEAIHANYQGLGFSDHIMLPKIVSDGVRARYECKDEYLSSIKNLKEKYKDQIKIFVGFECEWDKRYVKYYQNLLLNNEVDYLIFGNHSCYFKGQREYGLNIKSSKAYLKKYLSKAIAALNSNLFKIMAHPDIFMSSVPWDNYAKEVAYKLCKEAKKNNVVLELNCGCFINDSKENLFGELRYRYPYAEFWKIAKQVGNDIIVGIDAHSPTAFTSKKKELMTKFIDELNIKTISHIKGLK